MSTAAPTLVGSAGFRLASRQLGVDESAALAHQAVGPGGIVSRCSEVATVPGLPTVPMHVASGPLRHPRGGRFSAPLLGTGASDSSASSWLQAVVEVLERHSMMAPHDPELVVRASHHRLGAAAVSLAHFAPHSPDQYRSIASLHFPGPDEEIDWTWAHSLTRDCFRLVPARLALATVPSRSPNTYVHGITSTGVACHVSLTAAVLSALYEVVERDALMITWSNRRSPDICPLDGDVPSRIRELADRHFPTEEYRFDFLDLSVDTRIPVVGCLARSDNPSFPALALGAAARWNQVDAATKAMLEVAQILRTLMRRQPWRRADQIASARRVRTIEEHASYYAGGAGDQDAEFLTTSPRRLRLRPSDGPDSPETTLRHCLEQLTAAGLEVLVVDVTAPDVARCGFRTVRVMIPSTVDIHGDVRYPRLGSERLRTVPQRLRWPPPSGDTPNMAPCPLP